MRKLTKALAAVLLVAVVVSVMAVLPTFTASAAEATATEPGIVTMFDMDSTYASENSIKFSNVATTTNPIEYPKVDKVQDGGRDVWKIHYEGMSAGQTENTKDFLGSGGGWDVRIRDDEGDTGRSSSSARAGGSKNTDFIVIDLDVATDTEFINDIYWNCNLLKSGANNYSGTDSDGGSNRVGNGAKYYPAIRRGADGKIRVSNADGSNVLAAPYESDTKWSHVTIVYDFHTYISGYETVTDETTGETTENPVYTMANTAYVYIDGFYAGNINSMALSTSAIVFYLRMQTIDNDTLTADNESTLFANYTVKRFEAGYDGAITQDGILGNINVPLARIPELAYCMEDIPAPLDEDRVKIADIQRPVIDEATGEPTIDAETGEAKYDSIPVYDIDDLSGDLLDGDIVTVYRDIVRTGRYIVIKKVATTTTVTDETTGETTEVTEDVEASVVWQDVNGVELGADGSLFEAPTVLWAGSDASWAYIRNGSISWGGQSSYEGSGSTAVIVDPLWSAVNTSKGTMEIVLFEDYIMYGRSYGTAGSTSSSTKNLQGGAVLTVDLNGHSLTNKAKRSNSHLFTLAGANARVTFKNGTLVNNAGGLNLVMAQVHAGTAITIENCDVTISGTIFDQRGALLRYIDCDITANSTITNSKSTGLDYSIVMVQWCNITAKGGAVIDSTQTNQSKVGRYGSATNFAYFYDTDITGAAAIYDSVAYAHKATAATTEEYTRNIVKHYVVVDKCTVNTTNHLIITEIGTPLPTITDDETSEKPLYANYDISLKNSTLTASDLAYAYRATNSTEIVSHYGVNVDVKNCDINVSELSMGNGDYPTVRAGVDFTFDADNRFAKMPKYSSINNVTVILPEGHQMAYTSNSTDGYEVIVTPSYDTYTYQLGTQAPVEFYWYVPAEGTDAVDINKVVTIADDVAGVYKYSWAQDGKAFRTVLEKDFTVHSKSNLTLFDSFYYNLFIQADEYDAYKTYIQVLDANGNAIEPDAELANIGGTDYYKFQAKSAPEASASDAIKVVMAVEGVYDDSWSNTVGLSVFSYSKNILANGTDAESIALIKAVLNYMAAAMTYEDMDATEVETLIEGEEFAVPGSETIEGSVPGLELSVRYESEISWLLNATEDVTFDVTYTAGGTEMSYSKSLKAGETFEIKTKAYDLVNGLTVKSGDNTAVVTIAGYYNAVSEADAKLLIAAIYNYALAADAYKN